MSRLLKLMLTAVPQSGDSNKSIASILNRQLKGATGHLKGATGHVADLRKLETDTPQSFNTLCHNHGACQVTNNAHERMFGDMTPCRWLTKQCRPDASCTVAICITSTGSKLSWHKPSCCMEAGAKLLSACCGCDCASRSTACCVLPWTCCCTSWAVNKVDRDCWVSA